MQSSVSLNKARDYVLNCLRAGVVPFVTSQPGVGKSAMIRSIAKANNLCLLDYRMSQHEPTDFVGVPFFKDGRTVFAPPAGIPIEGRDEIPAGYTGWLLFMDEFNSASESTLAAAYKILLEREIGNEKIHHRVYMVCAGNTSTCGAIVNEIGTALRSRIVHINVDVSSEEFLETACKLGFDSRVVAYLSYQKAKINTFKEYQLGSADETFACPRTWDYVSRLCKVIEPDETKPVPADYAELLKGTVGSSAYEFVQFTRALDGLITFKEIVDNPVGAPVADKAAVRYLTATMAANNVTKEHTSEVCTYMKRMPKEFQLVFVKIAMNKKKWLMDEEAFQGVLDDVADAIF